jgi:hypothetical protein
MLSSFKWHGWSSSMSFEWWEHGWGVYCDASLSPILLCLQHLQCISLTAIASTLFLEFSSWVTKRKIFPCGGKQRGYYS